MATAYKTPGVFIEEIPKFPPSVAQVETAIPAFIGYTEKADNIAPGDLNKKPKRIGSLVEYELFFGYGPSPEVAKISIDDANNFKSADVKNKFYLYDSLRLFYSNGGGDCYIVSIGNYKTPSILKGHFTDGIDVLMKEDDPTILLFPDAVNLNDADLGAVQQGALSHCADDARRDRVAVMDVKENDPKGLNFRTNVGINFLSYGMAYTPWLKVSLPKNVKFPDVKAKVFRSGVAVNLETLTTDNAIKTQVTNTGLAYDDAEKIKAKIGALAVPSATLRDKFISLVDAYRSVTPGPATAEFQAIVSFLKDIGSMINALVLGGGPDELKYTALLNEVKSSVTSTLSPVFVTVVGLDLEAEAKIGPYAQQITAATVFTAGSWQGVAGAVATSLIDGTTDKEKMDNAVLDLETTFDKLNVSVLSLLQNTANAHAKKLDEGLEFSFPIYSGILKGVRDSISTMPPSGAVVGVYAMVDRTRGVWKAPANVSLSNVIEPAVTFTKLELDALNVDVNAGKSINAIRTFFGKGTLVYGARTLAGNDNEWRYVPVRRLFVMIEESVKKASEQFVFEPNDANTWVKVQAMIENFLHILWRQGALQGAKPEHAFYVAVGLGKTMNPVDILEGRMIIEIGLAAVRPAEFIILRFSHKMAES
jgi:uncharacterized protein